MNQANYYREFLHGVWHGTSADPAVAALLTQPAFAVYRNTIFKGCVDALVANYPTVERLVGAQWMQAVALDYARTDMPVDASLIAYGAGFADFLRGLDTARDLPYLSAVAALDRCWSESHLAANDPLLDSTALLAALAGGRDVRLLPHAAARWYWAPTYPAYSIWVANREAVALSDALEWHGEGALLSRPDDQVQWQPIGVGSCRFLDGCRQGLGVAEAAGLALDAQADLDVAAMLGNLILAGAFTSFH